MLQSLNSVLLVAIARRQLAQHAAQGPSGDRGREHLPIDQYAARLGLGAAHLNALCRRPAGQSALQLVNQRLLLEAKRCQVYTSMTVSPVSDSLGFSEPGYLSRFFKRGSGQSPKGFRLRR